MSRAETITRYLQKIADEVYDYVEEKGAGINGGWVPTKKINEDLGLKLRCVPKDNCKEGSQRPKGWLLGIIGRILEDDRRLEHKRKSGDSGPAYYRIKHKKNR